MNERHGFTIYELKRAAKIKLQLLFQQLQVNFSLSTTQSLVAVCPSEAIEVRRLRRPAMPPQTSVDDKKSTAQPKTRRQMMKQQKMKQQQMSQCRTKQQRTKQRRTAPRRTMQAWTAGNTVMDLDSAYLESLLKEMYSVNN